MSAPPAGIWSEWDTLRRLRETPQLLDAVKESRESELALQSKLRKEYPDELVRMALTLVDCRRRAAGKYANAEQLWFDRVGLEQGTHEAIARHKAQRFRGTVWDLCSGIGADASALARSCEVIGIDRNPANALRATWNAEVWGSRPTFIVADALEISLGDELIHIDPDRRQSGGKRGVKIEDYHPGLEFLQELAANRRGGAIKLSPASNFGGKFDDVEIELISWNGECKEATVWFGELAGESPNRATVLPAQATLAGDPLEHLADVTPLGQYLYDPDPAVVRAGLIDLLAETSGLGRLDASEEYLTSDERIDSPFVERFEVLAELPNQARAIRDYFRQSKFGQLEIKCRHIPLEVEKLRREIPLPGDERGVLILARLQGKARAVIARREPHLG